MVHEFSKTVVLILDSTLESTEELLKHDDGRDMT